MWCDLRTESDEARGGLKGAVGYAQRAGLSETQGYPKTGREEKGENGAYYFHANVPD